MICPRTSSVAPWSEIASRICCGCSASLRICGTRPEVEMVRCRAPRCRPHGEVMIDTAASRLSRFASGSPIPITTMWLIRSVAGRRRASRSSCSRISPVVRLRTTPSMPLAQNTHPIAQPTCELMQTVRRSPSRSMTHSIRCRSWSSSKSFSVPSSACEWVAMVVVQRVNSASRVSRRVLGRSVMSAKDDARLPYSQRRTAFARQAGWPSSASLERRGESGSRRWCCMRETVPGEGDHREGGSRGGKEGCWQGRRLPAGLRRSVGGRSSGAATSDGVQFGGLLRVHNHNPRRCPGFRHERAPPRRTHQVGL